MQLNADMCFTMRFGGSKTKSNASYKLHDQPLLSTDSVKYLGLTLTSDLKFNYHINNVTAKANSVVGLLRMNLKISTQAVETQGYKSLYDLTWNMPPRFRTHIHLIILVPKKWRWCRDVLQGRLCLQQF